MRLHITRPSPYARKIRVVIDELGLADRIEIIDAEPPQYGAFPASRGVQLAKDNPLGKVPALITDEGQAIFDSVVIADYLDSLAPDRALCPASGVERWRALSFQALADGMLDAGVLMRMEMLRPAALQWDLMPVAQREKLVRAFGFLEGDDSLLEAPFSIGTIALVCTLEWLQFRRVVEDWRAGHPRLAGWYDRVSKRDSFARTRPD